MQEAVRDRLPARLGAVPEHHVPLLEAVPVLRPLQERPRSEEAAVSTAGTSAPDPLLRQGDVLALAAVADADAVLEARMS